MPITGEAAERATYIYLRSGLKVDEGIEMEGESFEKKAVPVAVDTPLHIREKARVMAVLSKHPPSQREREERSKKEGEGGSIH